MLDIEIIKLIDEIKTRVSLNKVNAYIKKHYKELYSELLLRTKDICTSENPSVFEMYTIIKTGIKSKDELLCPVCKKNYVKFKNGVFNNSCSIVCANKNPISTQNRVKSRLANGGGKYISDATLEKMRKTCIERYGVDSYSKTKDYREKVEQTLEDRYGDKHYSNVEKMKQTKLERYGTTNYNNINKIRSTFFDKYGVYAPVQVKEIQERQRQTCLERYGVKSYLETHDCRNQSVSMSYEKMLNNDLDQPNFTIDDYKDHLRLNDELEFKCKKCGNVFYSKHDNGIHRPCPVCYPKYISNPEKELKDFVESLTTIKTGDRKLIEPNEIDINCVDKHIAIEFDGLYWHCDDIKTDYKYHLNKTEQCEKKDYQLIHIFENEWYYKQDIVKSRIKNLLGIYQNTVYARKCNIKTVGVNEAMNFLNENHIQGALRSGINYGLYHNNELISIMTFGKSRFIKKENGYEMLRFCNKLGYHIPGAASKLLKRFERDISPSFLVSYADRRWSKGALYQKLGFKFINNSKPNYWYFKGDKLYSRIPFQKFKLKNILENYDDELSEVENMKNNGYRRIFDCGNKVFIKEYVNENN